MLIWVGSLYFKNLSLRWQLIEKIAIPDVELINYLSFNSNGIAKGGVTGFVKFDDETKQPKDLRQYVEIKALNNFSKDGTQLFSFTDIIKMSVLAPRYFDPVILKVINSSGGILTLVDDQNNQYQVNKSTGEVSMFDATEDVTQLITNQSDFRKYIVELLK